MKFKASYFKQGKALGIENLRRFWPVPAIGFLIYFLSGVFPILLHYKNLKYISGYIQMSLENEQPFFMAAHLFLPVIAAVLVFRYLHGTSSVAVMHAMPFDRPTLFFSNFLSGLALCLSPVLVNGLILLCSAKPVNQTQTEFDELTGSSAKITVNLFSHAAVGSWIFESLLIILFIFAIAVFAGMVTGNSLMHFFTALGLNFAAPVLYGTVLNYFDTYLFGFYIGEDYSKTLLSLSPFLRTIMRGNTFSPLLCAGYLLVCFLVIAAALFLYRKRALEKCGSSLVFRFMETFVSFLITFFALSLFGYYFATLGDGLLYRYAGYVSGAVIGFLLSQMLVKKTAHIFNRNSLKRFSLYSCIFAVFFCCLIFDVTGYEKRIPAAENIASVELTPDFLDIDRGSYVEDEGYFRVSPNQFAEKENVQTLLHFHEQLLADRASYENAGSDPDVNLAMSNVTFFYQLENGHTMVREYFVPRVLLRDYEFLAPLYESEEFRKTPYIASIPAEHMNSVIFIQNNASFYSDERPGTTKITETEDMSSLIAALTADMTSRTFDSMIREQIPIGTLEVSFMASKQTVFSENGSLVSAGTIPPEAAASADTVNAAAAPVSQQSRTLSFTILPDYVHTLAWFSEHGYESKIQPLAQFARFMSINRSTPESEKQEDEWYELRDEQVEAGQLPESDPNHLVLTDPTLMSDIFRRCEERALDYNNYYTVMLAFPYSDPYMDANKSGYQYLCYYLNPSEAPEEVLAYFNK